MSIKIGKKIIAGTPNTDEFLNSPEFVGVPTVPTAPDGDSSKQIANTEYVKNAIENIPSVTIDQVYDETSSNAQSGIAIKSAIDSAISGVYKPAGSIASTDIPVASSENEGYVYNITNEFTTTESFVEGSGKTYPIGTNIVCINTDLGYKWDVLTGIVDLSNYQKMITASNKLSADLISDGSSNMTVTQSEKEEWSNKQDALVSGTNIKTINDIDILGNGNITIDSLPSQSGNSGKFLTTDGTNAAWSDIGSQTVDQTFDSTSSNAQSGTAVEEAISSIIPSQEGNDGKFLMTNGTSVSWNTPQDTTYNVFVGTNGATDGEVGLVPAPTYRDENKFLRSDGTWVEVENGGDSGGADLPSQEGNDGKFLMTNGTDVSWEYTQTTSNLVTSISSSSTDTQYPSAKCMYDVIGNIEELLSKL